MAPTESCAVNKRIKKGLSASTTDRSEGRDDVLDRDVVYQSHVSACLSTSFAVTSESLAGQLFHTALTHADNPPIAVRDTWSTIQSVLHSAISKQQLMAAVT